MSRLRVFADDAPKSPLITTEDPAAIAAELSIVGVHFERWPLAAAVLAGAGHDEVIGAYRTDVDRLMRERGYRAADVVSLAPQHPARDVLRAQFLKEHTHCEDEVRFFVAGSAMFSVHLGGRVYEVLCRQGDLIGIPDRTPHWFDMGPNPAFVAIRLYTSPNGWQADYTDSGIAERFARYEPSAFRSTPPQAPPRLVTSTGR